MELLYEFGMLGCKPDKNPLVENLVIDRDRDKVNDYFLKKLLNLKNLL